MASQAFNLGREEFTITEYSGIGGDGVTPMVCVETPLYVDTFECSTADEAARLERLGEALTWAARRLRANIESVSGAEAKP